MRVEITSDDDEIDPLNNNLNIKQENDDAIFDVAINALHFDYI
jgi:hypothetical protein